VRGHPEEQPREAVGEGVGISLEGLNYRMNLNSSELVEAAGNGQLEVVRRFLDQGAKVDEPNE